MLTTDTATLKVGAASRLYVLEFDMEHGWVQLFGQGDVYYSHSGRGETFLESGETGGCYTNPQMVADMQVWSAEEHFLAVFPDEASMRAGGRRIIREWGEELPTGIHRALSGQ